MRLVLVYLQNFQPFGTFKSYSDVALEYLLLPHYLDTSILANLTTFQLFITFRKYKTS